MQRLLRFSFLLTFLLTVLAGRAQLVLDGSRTPQELVQDVLVGPGITVSNVTFNGATGNTPNVQIGAFDATACVLGVDSGLLLCTGDIAVAYGPNDWGSAALAIMEPYFFNDPDLDDIADDLMFDPALLEFDLVPLGDTLRFEYVFASEEYLEWVGSAYNDVFGFFLSGPGISGPFTGGAINLALVPGTNDPVSVNTINDLENTAYYVDNGDGDQAPYNASTHYIQFDGYTRTLVAKAAVQCGQTYHIKLAICDVGDPDYDSGIFIRQGTLSATGGSGITIATTSGGPDVVEGCDSAVVTVTRAVSTGGLTMPITVSGSATVGADVSGIPPSVTFADGQATVSFPIAFLHDGSTEAPELLELSVETLSGPCQGISTARVTITDAPALTVTAEDVQGQCDDTDVVLQAEAIGGTGELAYVWSTGTLLPSTSAPDRPGTYTITVTDACGVTASATVLVMAPCAITVPNVFSPNGDGANDVFEIPGIEFVENRVRIFNRWGMPVFEAANYRNTWAAADVPDGTYFYEVMATGLVEPLTGHLTILGGRR
ncbi:MAG: choice-of-anchor L domain-containing protein [Bacteroidetes bacterium]|nr:choice-of-anchor L domain-containing protein [Bacteroidota bacterium]